MRQNPDSHPAFLTPNPELLPLYHDAFPRIWKLSRKDINKGGR